ncbi:hypothetical protein BO79DRAFT_206450 [Aspergillus costaricaensis CBS 115574]|uniref:Uncharacterized protein n=1 Tax=Aspergillus costaricaensis CBS 115574 TaxID=1448317 RepID=A0ACD1IUZ3_9EURO|nr:hypothetical protein BO79DRAFT_206450 [Aspergillus costaricaensis CBS 115574]RAK93464.1 hypothetical protein BO79DRAFT_206450 [Aspergillus costaricaensis CBS 115574]
MSISKPEVVLVGGGWHYPESYVKFRTALESQLGLTVHVPQLPTMNGSRPPNADLYSDSDAIRQIVTELADAGRSLVVIMHSYGGQVGTNALAGLGAGVRKQQGLSGGVIQLIYVGAHALKEGKSGMSIAEEAGRAHIFPKVIDFAEDGTCVHRDPETVLIGPGLPEEELEKCVLSLGRWNGKAFTQPLQHCAWREIPVSYIYTLNDITLPLHYQRAMVEDIKAAGRDVQTFDLDSGHCPTMTKPKEVATLVGQIVTSSTA